MFDLKLVLGIVLTLIGLWLLADKLSDISQTLQYKPTVMWAFILLAALIFVFTPLYIATSATSNGLQNAKPVYYMFILTIVIMVIAAVVLRTLPPHIVWPLWTGLGVAAPLMVSIIRGHEITPIQWAGVGLILLASFLLSYSDFSTEVSKMIDKNT